MRWASCRACVIGVASTAPGYSLAASLGFVVAVAGIGLQAPAVLLLAFVPMLLIASAYYYMNRADPDCGTTFSWVTRAMGPSLGWLGGWAIIVADVIVMANLAQIAGLYSFLLVGWQSAADSTVGGDRGRRRLDRGHDDDLRDRHRALRAHAGRPARRRDHHARAVLGRRAGQGRDRRRRAPTPSTRACRGSTRSQIDSFDAMISGVLIAVFIYWGWDSTVTVNEESRDAHRGSGQGGAAGDGDPARDLRDRRRSPRRPTTARSS